MKRRLTLIAVTLALAVAAFVAGRSVPRRGNSAAAAHVGAGDHAAAATDESAVAGGLPPEVGGASSRSAASRPRLSVPEQVLGREIPPGWTAVARENPSGARAIHQTVLKALEARRRAAGGGRDCFAKDVFGKLLVSFWVEVDSSATELRVGKAVFHAVSDGMPISGPTERCLEELLDGTDRVVANGDDHAFHDGYRGSVEYRVPFSFPTE